MRRLAILCLLLLLWIVPASATIRFVGDTGNTTTNGTNLKTALAATVCGDTVTLQVGITYFTNGGNFILANLVGCTTQTTICTGTAGGCVTTNLPAYGSRVIPGTHAQYMAKVVTDQLAVIAVASGAHYWTILGLDISDSYGGISLGPSNSISLLIDIGRNDTTLIFLLLATLFSTVVSSIHRTSPLRSSPRSPSLKSTLPSPSARQARITQSLGTTFVVLEAIKLEPARGKQIMPTCSMTRLAMARIYRR